MEEGKRQKQVAGLIQQELNDVFRHLGLNMMHGGMVSIANVKVTPDLLECRIYLSFFKIEDKERALKTIEQKEWEIKKELAARIRNQVRRMPVLKFYEDDTLDYVYKMEELLDKIKKEDENKPEE